jgi:hypothetical protein
VICCLDPGAGKCTSAISTPRAYDTR